MTLSRYSSLSTRRSTCGISCTMPCHSLVCVCAMPLDSFAILLDLMASVMKLNTMKR